MGTGTQDQPTTGGQSRQQVISLWATPKSTVGTWTAEQSLPMPLRLSDSNINSAVTFDFSVSGGTYTVDFTHYIGPNRGIYTVSVDGTTVGTVDGYAASFPGPVYTANIATIAGVTVSAGPHTITFTMASKNASSSAYYGAINQAVFTQTG